MVSATEVVHEAIISSTGDPIAEVTLIHHTRTSREVPLLSLQPLTVPMTPRNENNNNNNSSNRGNETDDQLRYKTYEMNVPYTPTGEEAELYKYYCPLCMLHFQSILKSKCCSNYICLFCTKDYLQTKHVIERTDNVPSTFIDDLSSNVLLNEINCPHCFTHGFHVSQVHTLERVRDYSWRNNHILQGVSKQDYSYAQPSPVRVGESFEDLKRKMIPFRALSNNNSTNELTKMNKEETPSPAEIARDNNSIGRPNHELAQSNSNRLVGIAVSHDDDHDHDNDESDDEAYDSPFLSPQSTYRSPRPYLSSQSNYRSPETPPFKGLLGEGITDQEDYSSNDEFSPVGRLFNRTGPLPREEEGEGPSKPSSRSNNRNNRHYSSSMDEISESVENIEDSLAGLRILARNGGDSGGGQHHSLACNVVHGVFSTAFSLQQIPSQ
jgi:hypothetical protein